MKGNSHGDLKHFMLFSIKFQILLKVKCTLNLSTFFKSISWVPILEDGRSTQTI